MGFMAFNSGGACPGTIFAFIGSTVVIMVCTLGLRLLIT